MKEHNSAFISLLEALTAASAPEEEIEREIDNNSDKEAQYSDYVDRMNRTLRREALLSKYRSTMAVMDSWLDNATDTAPDFAIKGEAIVKELDQLVTQSILSLETHFSNPCCTRARTDSAGFAHTCTRQVQLHPGQMEQLPSQVNTLSRLCYN